jgi:EAL domain-containing protein (putative c-di-GMP-specific phosphodiesterase class I)
MLAKLSEYDLKLAINVSLPQLIQINFIEKLSKIVKSMDLNPKRIILEITESIAMLETKQAIAQMESLKELGFEISIDDFGTGYSSFSRLYQMPLDELKIDTSFIRRLNTEKGLRIVQAIIQIGHALHLRLVAEGVEDLETYEKLKDLGVHNVQGYFIEKPMPFTQFLAFLQKKNNGKESDAKLTYEI